jgi:hypothetical protein
VYVRTGKNPLDLTRPADLPVSTLKALVLISDGPLPEYAAEGWDVCVAWSSSCEPRPIVGECRGWAVTDDVAVLFAALDIRARVHHLNSYTESAGSQLDLSRAIR